MSSLHEVLKAAEGIGSEGYAVHRLVCYGDWGGNDVVDFTVEVPGFMGWAHSKPLPPATEGGDVCYFTVCSTGLLSRIVLGDVAGQGQAVSATASTLRHLLRKHMNALDQSVLMQEINEAFTREDNREEVQYATAAVFGYFWKTRELIFAAGHPFALGYHAMENTWDWLHDRMPYRQTTVEGIPLGLILGTEYLQPQYDSKMAIFWFFTPTESASAQTRMARNSGTRGLLALARSLPMQASKSPRTVGQDLLSALNAFSGTSPAFGDQSLVVLLRTNDNITSYESETIKS
jgi:hypothetical protein